MSLGLIVGEGRNSESLADKIERLEAEIEELKSDLENMTREKDEQYDRAELLEEALNDLVNGNEVTLSGYEDYKVIDSDRKESLEASETRLYDIEEMCIDLKECYFRLNLGANYQIDEIIKLTDKLMEIDHE